LYCSYYSQQTVYIWSPNGLPQHGPRRKHCLHRCITPLLGVPRDCYLSSPLARWLLPSTDHTEITSTVLLTACVCWTVYGAVAW
jgi:hypothetical protein